MWREPTSTPRAPRQPLARVRHEPLGVALDDVLERAAVDLHRVRDAERPERAGEDHRPHDEVVGQRDVGAHALGDLADGGDVALDVALELLVGAVQERLGVEALVAVVDVDGQQVADVRAGGP